MKAFQKQLGLIALFSFSLPSLISAATPAPEEKESKSGHAYVGVFGGGGSTSKADVTQWGIAFNTTNPLTALPVDAEGKSGNFGSFLVGAHFGYEFNTGTCLTPALEFEGFYLQAMNGKTTSDIFNNSLLEHEFVDTLPLRTTAFMGHFLLSARPPKMKWLEPYVAGGIGVAILNIHDAISSQESPAEPGINHFNSKPSASNSAFAAQFKGGLRFNIGDHWRLFGEYRYLYVGSTTYTFGFTLYPFVHAPTSNWIVDLGSLHYNIGVAGIEYKF